MGPEMIKVNPKETYLVRFFGFDFSLACLVRVRAQASK